MLVSLPENCVFDPRTSAGQEDVVTDQLTTDGTITDVPSPLRKCPTCGAEFFVEAVSTLSTGHHPTTPGKRYTLRCSNGHEKTWVRGATELSAAE
jgi:hypothetical protein